MHWSVSTRLIAFTLVAAAGIGATSWLGLQAAHDGEEHLGAVVQSGAMLKNQLLADMLHDGIRGDVMVALLAEDAAGRAAAEVELRDHGTSLRELVENNRALAEEGHADKELLARFEDTQREIDAYVKTSLEIVALAERSREDAIAALPSFEVAFSELEEPMEAVADAILAGSELSREQMSAGLKTAERNVSLAAAAAILALLAMGWTTSRSIRRPITEVSAAIDALAHLDLTHQCNTSGIVELEQMAGALNRATTSLCGALGAIADSVESLSGASEELSGASQRMTREASDTVQHAEAASGEASRVDQNIQTVSSCIAQMEATVQEIAKTSEDASQVAGVAVESAESARRTINELVRSSEEVAGIVRVINEIAEQTNLLALNATIEAARAGELGKGFAVVAGEVKELAKQTAEATEDISRRVQASQDGAAKATRSIGEIAEVIQKIHGMQSTTSAAIYEQATVTSEIGRSIGDAANESASIARRMKGVSHLAEETRGDLQTVAESATAVARNSTNLHDVVKRFRYTTSA
jgi:methyl-accepting chemotaxis protein